MKKLMTGAALVAVLAGCGNSAGGSNPPRTPTPVEDSSRVTVYVDQTRNVACYYVHAGAFDGGVSIDCVLLNQGE